MTPSALFQSVRIGTLWLRNRIVMAPMHSNLGNENGAVTDRLTAYLAARACGGAGLIMVEHAIIEWPRGKNGAMPLNISHERFVPALAEAVEAVHAHGAKVAIQIDHAGRQSTLMASEGTPLVSASDVAFPPSGTVPRPLTQEEIGDLVRRFGDAAHRARTAGFDAVEIHSAHGYLLASFLSPYTNRRADAYGGSLKNRMRFLLQIVAECRRRVGPDFPLLCRLNGADFVSGGLTSEDSVEVARRLEAAGVDGLHVSAALYESREWMFPPMQAEPGCLVPLAAAIKRAVHIPVIAVGKINSLELAARIVREGQADLVALGRPLLADPDLPRKAAAGREAEIRPCIYCNQCLSRIRGPLHVACAVNPSTGREREFSPGAASKARRVVVVGGGPAGMEAARVAAERGHRVTLFEREPVLGGKVRLSATLPWRRDVLPWLTYLERELGRCGVEVCRGAEVRNETILDLRPDVVLVATGTEEIAAAPAELGAIQTATLEQAIAGNARIAERIVVLGGGHLECEVAAHLAGRGHRVTLVEPGEQLASDMEPASRALLLRTVEASAVEALTGWSLRGVSDGHVVVGDGRGERAIPTGTVLVAGRNAPRDRIAAEISGRVEEVRLIGDCAGSRGIMQAVYDAAVAARQV